MEMGLLAYAGLLFAGILLGICVMASRNRKKEERRLEKERLSQKDRESAELVVKFLGEPGEPQIGVSSKGQLGPLNPIEAVFRDTRERYINNVIEEVHKEHPMTDEEKEDIREALRRTLAHGSEISAEKALGRVLERQKAEGRKYLNVNDITPRNPLPRTAPKAPPPAPYRTANSGTGRQRTAAPTHQSRDDSADLLMGVGLGMLLSSGGESSDNNRGCDSPTDSGGSYGGDSGGGGCD